MRAAELITACILALFSGYIMWKAGEPPSWNPSVGRFANVGFIEDEGPGSGFWPFWLAAIMLLSCVWTIANWARRVTPHSRSQAVFLDGYGKKMLVYVGGGIIGFLIAIEVLGFYGAIPAFLVYYMRILGGHSWRLTLTIALMTPLVFFFFFDVAMRIVLPKGYLEPLFIPLYAIFL
ncbi:MAG: tripartite tricarboxylate transporter TctB family protein [Pseudomonadota bacterium]